MKQADCTRLELKHSQESVGLFLKRVDTQSRHAKVSLHPIKNCPEDILRLIFEEAVKIPEPRLRSPFRLAHVSRPWRTVALHTPFIWSYIEFKTMSGTDAIGSLMSHAFDMLRDRPPNIVIKCQESDDMPDEDEAILLEDFFKSCDLNRFRQIDSIMFDCIGLADEGRVIANKIHYSGSLRRLILKVPDGYALSLTHFFECFPSAQGLELTQKKIPRPMVDSEETIPKIHYLWLSGTPTAFLFLVPLSWLSHLEELTLQNADSAWNSIIPDEAITVPKLLKLQILDGIESQWRLFHMPLLNTIVVSNDSPPLEFLRRHTSLRHLHIDGLVSSKYLTTLATACPSLETLAFNGLHSVLERPLFQRLTSVTLYDVDIGLVNFEEIVESFCLPLDFSYTRASLTFVLSNFEDLSSTAWMGSTLMRRCTQRAKLVTTPWREVLDAVELTFE